MSARRRWAWPLVPVYGAALAAKDAVRAAGFVRERRLGWPVISVGSVSAGGAGKTPVVIALATLLRDRGWNVDVLSRGYGRSTDGTQRVLPEADDAARHFGDEPVLIGQRAGVPVWVGSDRLAAGRAAEQERAALHMQERGPSLADADQPPAYAHILDDGMQHRGLHRDFELVVLTLEDLTDALLPAGNLREPLAALRRADAFAVREDELEKVSERLAEMNIDDVPVWTLRRGLRFPAPLGVFSAGLRPIAFCGIARPEGFAASLLGAGCGIVDTVVFSDHHRYEERDVQMLGRVARQLRGTGLITTEKDAVKLSAGMRARLETEIGPLAVVRLDVNFVYESPVVRALESRLRGSGQRERQVEARVP